MKRYSVKATEGCSATLDVLCEVPDGYFVRVTRVFDGYEEATESVMNRELFELCLRTHFMCECGERTIERVA